MKQIAAILMIFIMLFLSTYIFANDRMNFGPNSLEDKMLNYERIKGTLSSEITQLQNAIDGAALKVGFDFSQMDENELKEFIVTAKKYLQLKQILVNELSQIYIPSQVVHHSSIDEQVSAVLAKLRKDCGPVKAIISKCFNANEELLFTAVYLNEKIEETEMLESSLTSELNFLIQQENGNIANNIYL